MGAVAANVGTLGDRIGVAQQLDGEHEKRKAEAVVEHGLGGDDLSQRTSDVFVGKRALGDSLGQNGIGAGDGRGDGEGGEEGDLGDGGEEAGGCDQPHRGHDGNEADEELLLTGPDVPGGQLVASDDELDADHNSSDALPYHVRIWCQKGGEAKS